MNIPGLVSGFSLQYRSQTRYNALALATVALCTNHGQCKGQLLSDFRAPVTAFSVRPYGS